LYLAIATLGFGEVVRVIALNLTITHGALGFSGIPSMASTLSDYASDWGLLDALEMDSQTGGQFLMCIVLLLIVIAIVTFWYRLEHSRVGRAMAAVKADEYAASLTGINVVYYKMMAFLFSAFFAGVAGALYAHATFFITPISTGTKSSTSFFTPYSAAATFSGALSWALPSLPSFRNPSVLFLNTET
jgi:branched-chain amino acid transport system permease protein